MHEDLLLRQLAAQLSGYAFSSALRSTEPISPCTDPIGEDTSKNLSSPNCQE